MAHTVNTVEPFHFEDRSCTACHTDPHHGEFRERMARRRADGSSFGCEACHNTKSWIDVRGFDHSKTQFPLLGAHRTVTCGGCHKPAPGSREIQFKGAPQRCDQCHTDPHGGQFTLRAEKIPCAECHTAQRWVPSTFDHDKRTKFPLQGGHEGVKCDRCHNTIRFIGDKQVLFYKPTPLQCVACHSSETVPRKPLSPPSR
jgi:hypothetical protein